MANSSWKLPDRLAYVVSHSYPYSSNGYAVRTHEVARALGQLGHDVVVINRPGRPWDIDGFSRRRRISPEQVIDGVRYVFLPMPAGVGRGFRDRMRGAERGLMEAFGIFRPAAVLAASNWQTGEPAQNAARRWGVPFFYEQRGFWELSRAVCEPGYERTEDYERDRRNELRVAQRAEAVFTLNAAMRDEMVRQGVPGDRIELVPNGVSALTAQSRGAAGEVTREGIGCGARHLLGYFGSLSAYEGSEDLIRLLARLRQDGVDVAMMIVGSGAAKGLIGTGRQTGVETGITALARSLGVADHLHLVPRVPQQQMAAYYALADAMIMPRRSHAVTELVAPLKPYSAASHGLPVFMSDIAPLAEIAGDIHAVLFPEGDIETLAGQVKRMLETGAHPARTQPLAAELLWSRRVAPISRHLHRVARSVPALPLAPETGDRGLAGGVPGFDLASVPQAALRDMVLAGPIAAIGPCAHLAGRELRRLTRNTLLAELATGPVGHFIIDWRGLQEAPGEWDGLWSMQNMRLNRQIMDACRIAVARGWRLQVTGPVRRGQAPLYRTVSAVFEEVLPEGRADIREAAQ